MRRSGDCELGTCAGVGSKLLWKGAISFVENYIESSLEIAGLQRSGKIMLRRIVFLSGNGEVSQEWQSVSLFLRKADREL